MSVAWKSRPCIAFSTSKLGRECEADSTYLSISTVQFRSPSELITPNQMSCDWLVIGKAVGEDMLAV